MTGTLGRGDRHAPGDLVVPPDPDEAEGAVTRGPAHTAIRDTADAATMDTADASAGRGAVTGTSEPACAGHLHEATEPAAAAPGATGAGAAPGPAADACRVVLPPGRSLAELVADYERRIIERALEATRGNRSRAARLLRTTERIFGYRVKQYGIDWRAYRD